MFFFFFKQKTAYEMRISDWSSDVCSSDLGDDAVFAVSRHFCGRGPLFLRGRGPRVQPRFGARRGGHIGGGARLRGCLPRPGWSHLRLAVVKTPALGPGRGGPPGFAVAPHHSPAALPHAKTPARRAARKGL